MAGWDVVVHFDSKEDADKFESSVIKDEGVCIPDSYTNSANFLEAAYVETLECPR